MTRPLHIEALGAHHDRTGFSCGVEALDHYLREQASQDVRRRATACFVALENPTSEVKGYFTLAASGVPLMDMPDPLIKRLPRYPCLPVARLGRLAVDMGYQGRRLGGALLWDAIMRASRSEVAVFALVVDAKDDRAESFYLHHGFVGFGSLPRQMILPLSSVIRDLAKNPILQGG